MSITPRIPRSASNRSLRRPAVVFGLDETLVHVTPVAPQSREHFQIRVSGRRFFVQPRPGLAAFLTRVQRLYDVFFFTASQPEYANPIIDAIAPNVRPCRRYFRNSCRMECGYWVKDLAVLRRPIVHTVLIDDVEGSALANPTNLIRIKPWAGEPKDNVLMEQLLPLLEQVAIGHDMSECVREVLRKEKCASLRAFSLHARINPE
jgi:Dullard-like phosphatase family protein